jgi:hypothetical protein
MAKYGQTDSQRSEQQERLLYAFEAVWKRHPDWRFGQMVSNIMGAGRQDVFYPEDHEWQNWIDSFRFGPPA